MKTKSKYSDDYFFKDYNSREKVEEYINMKLNGKDCVQRHRDVINELYSEAIIQDGLGNMNPDKWYEVKQEIFNRTLPTWDDLRNMMYEHTDEELDKLIGFAKKGTEGSDSSIYRGMLGYLEAEKHRRARV